MNAIAFSGTRVRHLQWSLSGTLISSILVQDPFVLQNFCTKSVSLIANANISYLLS